MQYAAMSDQPKQRIDKGGKLAAGSESQSDQANLLSSEGSTNI